MTMDNDKVFTLAVVDNSKIVFSGFIPITLATTIDRFEVSEILGLSKKIISKAFYPNGIENYHGIPLLVLYLESQSHATV